MRRKGDGMMEEHRRIGRPDRIYNCDVFDYGT